MVTVKHGACPYCGSEEAPRRVTDSKGEVYWCVVCKKVWEGLDPRRMPEAVSTTE